ncbi:hypothetical protein VTK56DRAFT_7831 [Thermocarpiscus australiensis]
MSVIGPDPGPGPDRGGTPVVVVPDGPAPHVQQKTPQNKIDEFWKKFTTKAPGKATTILPKNELTERLAKRSAAKDLAGGGSKTTTTSYEEAAALCRAKVEQIVAECRRVNQKYTDPHFDLDFDLKSGRRDCLESLANRRHDYDSDSGSSSSSSSSRSSSRARQKKPRRRGDRADNVQRGGDDVVGGRSARQRFKHRRRDGEEGQVSDADGPRGPWDRRPGHDFRPQSVKRVGDIFDDPKFYIDGPTANDVRQGRDGDCWLMAALCTLSNKPGLIERICVAHNQDVGVYGFVFHRDGEWYSEIIDDKLYLIKPDYDQKRMDRYNLERTLWEDIDRPDSEEIYRRTYQSNSGALYFAQCENPNETWLPLLEKAYAKAHGDYAAIEGGFTGEGIEDLTGGVTTELFTADILDKEYFWKGELMKVNKDFLFGCSTGLWGLGYGERKGIIESHAYSVMRAVEIDGQRLLLLKNPWGKGEWKGPWSDGSKEWTPEWLQKLDHRFGDDGAFWISYKDFLRKYQTCDRTRLFGPEWKITSMWTTLNVPWSVEYHDTKFTFTLAKSGPVVIVLSQLDDRYFRGLEDQYRFGLGFRVHRAGEEDYLVRTQTTYRMRRSCSVELELEAGEYTVLIKIDATRRDWILPPEDVVRLNAKERREKLLRIGLAYDLAHSKARLVETAEEKAAREAYEKRKNEKHRERIRKAAMEEKRRNHYEDLKKLKYRRKEFAWRKEFETKRAQKQKERRTAAEEDEAARQEGPESASTRGGKASRSPAREVEQGPSQEDQSPDTKGSERNGTDDKKEKGPEVEHQMEDRAGHEDEPEAGRKDDKRQPKRDESADSEDQPAVEHKGIEKQPTADDSAGYKDQPEAEHRDVPKQAKTEASEPEGCSGSGKDTPPISHPDSATAEGEDRGEGSNEVSTGAAPTQAEEKTSDAVKPAEVSVQVTHKSIAGDVPTGEQPPAENAPNPGGEMDASPHSAGLDGKIKKGLDAVSDVKEALERLLDDSRSGPDGEDDDHEHAQIDHPHGMHSPPGPPGPPSYMGQESEDKGDRLDLCSLPSLSDISDTELDYLVKDHDRQVMMLPPPRAPPPQPLDEFESDPWNAVAVVGLRIYYKAAEEDQDAEGHVKLRVVRPNHYELSDDEDEEKKEGDEADKEGTDETKVLDLDDSAKDATVTGEARRRR